MFLTALSFFVVALLCLFSIVWIFEEEDVGGFGLVFGIVIGILSITPSVDTQEGYTKRESTVIYSTNAPEVMTEGFFILGTGLIENKVGYILRQEVQGGMMDKIVTDIILTEDEELSTTARLDIEYSCNIIKKTRVAFFIVERDSSETEDCEDVKKVLRLPPNSIIKEMKV